MKFTAALIAAAAAAPSDFPSFDSFHAHCGIATQISADCGTVYQTLSKELVNFQDPAHGLYQIKEQSNGFVWVTRTTPTKHYVDDIEFTMAGANSNGGCSVTSKSRSQTLSYYDYNTNYCNMYNVLRKSGLSFTPLTTNECKWVPDDLSICDTY